MAWRKLGLMIETMTHRTIRRMSMPSSFFMDLLRPTAGRQVHHGFFTELRSFQNSGDPFFVHDGYAIADSQYFFHFAADGDDRNTLRGELAHQGVNLGLCADINSTRRFVKD